MFSNKLINKNFMLLSKKSKLFLEEKNKILVKRNKETNIFDGFIFKLLYSQKRVGQIDVVKEINDFKHKFTDRSCYLDRTKLITEDFLCDYFKFLDEGINNIFYKDQRLNTTILPVVSCDGSKSIAYYSSKNKPSKKKNKNDTFTFLNMGMFNVTYNEPCLLKPVEHKNERKAMLDNLNNNSNPTIYVSDRGFQAEYLFNKLNNNGDYFICRLRSNSLVIDKSIINDEYYVNMSDIPNVRIINYKINDNDYYIATNVPKFMYNINDILNIYHKRWIVEEYFKYIKNNMKMDNFSEKDWMKIKASIYCNLIISKLTYLIQNIFIKKIKNKNQTINKASLTRDLYKKFLIRFIFNLKFSERFLIKFFKIAIDIIITHLDISNPRRSMFPYTKWYIKGYHKKYILEEIK